MSKKYFTLEEIVKDLYPAAPDGVCTDCPVISANPGDCRHIFGLPVTGVDIYKKTGGLSIGLISGEKPHPECERRFRSYLSNVFACGDVKLSYSGDTPAALPDAASGGIFSRTAGGISGAALSALPNGPPAAGIYPNAAAPTAPGKPKRARGGAVGNMSANKRERAYAAKNVKLKPREKIRAGDFEASMKGIVFEDGAYFEKNPDIICGAPVKGAPLPISKLSDEQLERATISGEVVTVNYKPVRGGEVYIMECGISDGTGSIAVKMFIPAEHIKLVRPKIIAGGEIIVYGEIRYDAYLKEPALYAVDIGGYKSEARTDDAPVKRVELHMHTQMSALDAVTPVSELVKKAAVFGHKAVAVTDHGVVQAYPEAYEAGLRHSVKIIYGVEAYLDSDGRHIIILVKNNTGLKNLYKLISKSHLEYYHGKPRMPRAEIETHREGLIIGSACEAGEIFTAFREKKAYAVIAETAAFYDYLEIQPVGNNMFMLRDNTFRSVEDLRQINRKITALGEDLGKPVAATCDVHFLEPRDEVFRRILMSGQGYQDADSQPPLFFKTTAEMLEEFDYLGAEKAYEVVVTNPNLISGWIENGIKPIPDGTYTPDMEGAEEELRQITEEAALRQYGANPPRAVRERLDQELEIIISKHFSVLYMIAHKLVKKSNDEGYMVGSRGSVGSSLVAALSGITEVTPLPPHYLCGVCKHMEFVPGGTVSSGYDLPAKKCPDCGRDLMQDGQDIMFEIFIGAKGSEKAPDIDLNFSGEYQLRAHKHTEELFGADNVFKAGTINTIADKTAYGFVKKYLESKGLAPGKIEEERLTKGCTGVKRTTGQHPGGIVVIPRDKDIYDFTPVQRPADAAGSDVITTHFHIDTLKETILKLDLLGHDDPSIIKMLEELTGVKADSIKMGDQDILSLFSGTAALGVTPDDIGSPVGTIALPEFGTRFIRQMLVDTKPKDFSDLIQISGLSHGTNVWLNNAQDLIRNGVCTVSEVIGTRESLVLYLMNLGMDKLTSFQIMEAVRKNKGVSAENEKKMLDSGVPAWYIDSCNKIEYLFPKAHATAYVLMAYRQAWYKIHRPQAFYAAYFTIRADEFDAGTMTRGIEQAKMRLNELDRQGREISPREQKIQTILEVVVEMYARGIKFLPIDLYRSDAAIFTIEEGGLRPPLASLSGIGASAAEGISEARKGLGAARFISIEDLTARSKITKTAVEALNNYGALEGLPGESQMTIYDIIVC